MKRIGTAELPESFTPEATVKLQFKPIFRMRRKITNNLEKPWSPLKRDASDDDKFRNFCELVSLQSNIVTGRNQISYYRC